MRDLEQIMREQSRKPLPETPPDGGFSAIRDRLSNTQARMRKTRQRWSVLLLLLIGLSAWWMQTSTVLKPVVINEEVRVELPERTLTVAVAQPSKVSTDPGKSSLAEMDTGRSERAMPSAPVLDQTANLLLQETEITVADVGPTVKDSSLRPTEDTATAVPHVEEGRITNKLPTLPFNPLRTRDRAALAKWMSEEKWKSATTARVSVANVAALKNIPADLNKQALRGWDVAVSWNVLLGEARQSTLRLTDQSSQSVNPDLRITEIVNGSPRVLYYATTHEYNTPLARQIEYSFLQVQINRQLTSGWRFGIGALALQQLRNDERRVRQLAAEQNDPTLYYLTTQTRNTYWMLQGQVGYTFSLGRRWRPWIGINMNVGLQTRKFYEAHLVNDGTLSRILTIESRDNGIEDLNANAYLALVGGLSYRINRRFSVGLIGAYIPKGRDLSLPLPGLEVRTHF